MTSSRSLRTRMPISGGLTCFKMPVYVDAFNKEMALLYLLSNIGTFSEVCENNHKSLLPPLVATTPPCVRSPGCIVWRPPGSAAEGWHGSGGGALATPRTINKIGFCGFVQPPNSVTLLATLRPSLLLNTLMLTNHYTLYMQISTSGLLSQSQFYYYYHLMHLKRCPTTLLLTSVSVPDSHQYSFIQ